MFVLNLRNFFNNDLKVSQRRTSCVSLVAQEEKWKRRVDALDTAIEIYLEKGYLHNDKQITITKGNPYCTTSYGNVRDQSHRHAGTWSDVAVYPLGLGNNNFLDNKLSQTCSRFYHAIKI